MDACVGVVEEALDVEVPGAFWKTLTATIRVSLEYERRASGTYSYQVHRYSRLLSLPRSSTLRGLHHIYPS